MRRGQIWVETVIYTLIGLSLIGVVLALITPKINEYRDRSVIEQTIESLNIIDKEINDALQAPGNTRVVNFRLKRGDIYFNATSDQIIYVLEESNALYSEPGQPIDIGRVTALTKKGKKTHRVELSITYLIDIDYENNQTLLHYTPASVPYRFSFSHAGFVSSGTATRASIFIREISGA